MCMQGKNFVSRKPFPTTFHISNAAAPAVLDKLAETHRVSDVIIMSRTPLDTPIRMHVSFKFDEHSKFKFLIDSPNDL